MRARGNRPFTNRNRFFAEQQNQPTVPNFKPITRLQHQRYKSLTLVSQQIKPQSSVPSPIAVQQKTERRNSINYLSDHLKSEEQTKICEYEQTQREQFSAWKDQLAQYRQDITEYVCKREQMFTIDTQYLRHYRVVTNRLRNHLVRHIYKMYLKFELLRTTLHLAVFYLDLYCSQLPMFKNQLEGVATAQACLFIAMKYQEIYPPQLRDWVDSRHRHVVLQLQAMILKALDYQLMHYTVENHINWIMWQRGDEQQDDQINLLADLTLFDLNMRHLRHAELAEAIYKSSKKQPYDNQKMVLNIKWMVQRNAQQVHWLCQQKYHNLNLGHSLV